VEGRLVRVAVVVAVLILGAAVRSVVGPWWDLFTVALLASCAAVMLVRGRPGERLFVASLSLPFLVVLGFALMLAAWS